MQLTRLEIKGFKSFADKVTINFDEGITGIVGPNGCGKSNVVDAIRWVLGETKTRVLRSEKMENIIFNGTKKRKPTQLAEVSLTFNNTKNLIPTEYSQVTITRKYFRSGDSEYMLNGVTCRRKDITNLFLDTGIASNSYAIIELKMVDDLLNDKDNSRRTLFEEAAGIAKFKIRKKETLKKLEDTDADLDRVEDLLFEIEKNLKSLERQARQAKRYYEIKEDYKASSIALAKITANTQLEIQKNIENEIQNHTDRKGKLQAETVKREADLEAQKKKLVERENLLSSRQKTLNDHVNKIRQYESEKKIKNERKRFLDDRIDALKEQIKLDKQSNERSAFAIKGLEGSKVEAEKELGQAEKSLGVFREEYESQKETNNNAQRELDELNRKFSEQRESVFRHTKDIEIKKIQLESLKNELEKSGKDSTEHTSSLDQFKVKIAEFQEAKGAFQKQFETLKLEQDKVDEHILKLQDTIETSREELQKTNRKLDSNQNEFNLTKSMVDNLEGFPEAIRFLKTSDGWENIPLVSDIISCPEDFRICIENYLESVLSYFVVEDRQQAIKAINLLNESGQGKANFFIRKEINSKTFPPTEKPKDCQSALELIDFDPNYEPIVKFLLGNVFIYEGEELAGLSDDHVLLEKSGTTILRKFSISGGSVGLFEGKRIGRVKNLEKLGNEIKKLESDQNRLQTKLDTHSTELELKKKEIKTIELENIREEISSINESLASLESKRDQFNEMISNSTTRQSDIKDQIIHLNKDLESISPELDKEKAGFQAAEEQVKEHRESMELLIKRLSEKTETYNKANVLFHQKQNTLNSLEQEISYKQESFEQSRQRIEKNSEQLHQTEKDSNELARKTVENDDELISMYDEKESIEVGVNEAEKEYYTTRGSIDKEEKEIRETQRQRETIDQILMEWSNKLNEVKLSLTSVKERLSVEFNVDFDQLDDSVLESQKEISEEELEEKVNKLKNRMESIGPINPMAMEAFDEIKERHDFISSQKDDLLKAKESLLTTISEIDTVAKDTFQTAFEQIKENFIKVFRTLFTHEDDCDLFLTDPENPLESPIEITAKPKGKRPLSINQLSGGEKTLTATSLLFAIYLIKPAPFCIFDEVDAPLDDANIDKFNQIIREFSKDSQFIIVTHNKRTMASTDIVYGITMIEQGISRVVPVDLRELA